jgi:hypothetical protein
MYERRYDRALGPVLFLVSRLGLKLEARMMGCWAGCSYGSVVYGLWRLSASVRGERTAQMSLVVAQVTEDGPRIVSDTRVTFQDERRPSFKSGTLKTIVVSREFAIAFSGDVEVGLRAVRAFAECVKRGCYNEDAELKLLEAASQGATGFIIARAGANHGLIRIRSRIERDLPAAWIGDPTAFEKFQAARNRHRGPNEASRSSLLPQSPQVMMSLNEAMSAVIADSTVGSVDDFCVGVAAISGAFNYMPSMFIHLGRDIQIRDGDDLVTKMAQSVAEGGYAVSVVEPLYPGTAALGLNFPRAELGILFLPVLYGEGQIVEKVSANDFPRVVRERFGVELSMPMLRTP